MACFDPPTVVTRHAVFFFLLMSCAVCVDSDNAMADTDSIVPEILFDDHDQFSLVEVPPPIVPEVTLGKPRVHTAKSNCCAAAP